MKYHILFIYFFLLSLGAYGQSAQKIPTFIDLENINDISSDEKRLVKKSLYEALLSGKNFDLNINGSIPVADKEKKDWLLLFFFTIYSTLNGHSVLRHGILNLELLAFLLNFDTQLIK